MKTDPMSDILIVGTGSIGERHLRCFQAARRGAVSACEPNETLRRRIETLYNCETFASLEEALEKRDWKAAVICTPAPTHIPIAARCAARGMHLLVEKPLSASLEGVETLLAEIRGRHLVARMAYVHRSIPALISMKEIVSDGCIGEIKHVVATAGQHFPSFRPAYASTYFARHSTGGGCIQDGLTHIVHTVEWLAAPFVSVMCDAAHQALEGIEVEDTVNLTGRLRGGALVSLAQNQFQAPNELTLTLHGTCGSARAELHRQRIGTLLHGQKTWQWRNLPEEDRDQMFIRQANAFLDAAEGQSDHLATLEDGLQTLKVNLAALQSVKQRMEISL